MQDTEVVSFLQRTLPRLRLRWSGFRKVRGQVRKRLARRLAALGLPDLRAYETWLDEHPDEWPVLDELCRVTISRFNRDRQIFAALGEGVLPLLAERHRMIRAWSAGCASGEEPYSLSLLWQLRVSEKLRAEGASLEIIATDTDSQLLERARQASYPRGTLRELPTGWIDRAFRPGRGGELQLLPEFRAAVAFEQQDLRGSTPAGPFQLILCRNLAFTYFEETLQRETLARLAAVLSPGGFLVLGCHERLPDPTAAAGFDPWPTSRAIYRRALGASRLDTHRPGL